MKIIKKKKKKTVIKKDSKKESVFKHLSGVLSGSGHEVRREPLKQGHGWRVLSGACEANDQNLIFVDRRLTQDEQINFLATRIVSLGIALSEDELAPLPERLQNLLTQKAA